MAQIIQYYLQEIHVLSEQKRIGASPKSRLRLRYTVYRIPYTVYRIPLSMLNVTCIGKYGQLCSSRAQQKKGRVERNILNDMDLPSFESVIYFIRYKLKS